jgi:hypothetical protein
MHALILFLPPTIAPRLDHSAEGSSCRERASMPIFLRVKRDGIREKSLFRKRGVLMHRIARQLFWQLMVLFVLVGVLAAALSWGAKPSATGWTGWALGIGIWVGAFGLLALLLRLISYATDLFVALAAMWRPLVLILAAAYLLFSNDQGRELGVGLVAENNGSRLFFLFLALIYWAANNWHTARLGLRAAVRRRWLVAWTAPLIIIVSALLIWAFDRLLISERRSDERTTRTWIAGAVVAILLVAGIPGLIALVAFAVPSLPPGFSWGTFAISASAMVFLLGISFLRRRAPVAGSADDRRENLQIFLFTAGLFAIAFVFACATLINPMAVGWSLGSMVVAYFALGATLALVNAIEFQRLAAPVSPRPSL